MTLVLIILIDSNYNISNYDNYIILGSDDSISSLMIEEIFFILLNLYIISS